MSDIDPKLLSQLRIEGEHREDDDGRGRRVLWLALAGVILVAALGGAAWWWLAARPLTVQTATAINRTMIRPLNQ